MATNSFNSHLSEIGEQLQRLRQIIGDLEEILNRHNHNNYGALAAGDYIDPETTLPRQVDKGQYDAAMVSVSDLINTWLPAGHGTNIDGYLYEVP